eukprot:4834713-Prymnesium_polylepis.1
MSSPRTRRNRSSSLMRSTVSFAVHQRVQDCVHLPQEQPGRARGYYSRRSLRPSSGRDAQGGAA